MKFYLTFGQQSPFKDNWVEVEAPNESAARAAAHRLFGVKWSMLYPEGQFKPEHFPGGKAGRTVIAPEAE